MKYKPTIGLEVHAELATESKMFCGCKNDPHSGQVNAHICPVCLAHPGTLPAPNREAIAMVLKFGAAVGAKQADFSEFDRKNYFYPDIPKAYQISQYQFPFLEEGSLNDIQLTRVHLEEDTARSSHELTEGSVVDFNRAGVPLMELVTEPVIHSAKTAGDFARELQLLLQTLGISHANMEKGEMRIEVNLSLSDNKTLGTKVEVKNINSFKAVESAIAYEIDRQAQIIESGGEIVQETRGWDENKVETFSQRSKETAKDYRYFPDPDIPKIKTSEIAEFDAGILRENLPVLPAKKREIYSKYKVSSDTVELLITNTDVEKLVNAVIDSGANDSTVVLAINYATVDLVPLERERLGFINSISVELFVELMELVTSKTLGSRAAKDILPQLPNINSTVFEYAQTMGLLQESDEAAISKLAQEIVSENEDQVNEYKAGKETVLKYLVGQGMKMSKGSANPSILEKALVTEMSN